MKQVIPFYKEIVFKTNIASITSISLEHEEKINNGEVNGEFIILGDYKVHSDTTERELFKYKLPFTAIIPDDVDVNTIVVDIENFTYEQIENDVLRVNIDFSIQGDVIEELSDNNLEEKLEDRVKEVEEVEEIDKLDYEIEQEIEEILNNEDCLVEDKRDDNITKDNNVGIEDSVINNDSNNSDEYVTYHIHIVKDNENIENIVKQYNTNIDYIKEYNEITNINVGDKVIIPEYGEE